MLVQVFLWFIFFISLSFFLLDSVLLVGSFSLVFSLIVCYLVSAFFSSWFGVIVVVVYIGGLLVMFSYFLAIFPNQAIKGQHFVFVYCIGLSVLMFVLGVKVFYCPVMSGGINGVEYLYSSDVGSVLIFFVLFLLLCLFCVVSIVQVCGGPLRPFLVESR